MTYYLYEDDVRIDEYSGHTVLDVLEAIADSCGVDEVKGPFAGDLTISNDDSWQDLLDMYREEEEPDSLEAFLRGAGVPEHVPDGQLVLYLAAHPLSGPFQRDGRPLHVLIPENPSAGDIHKVFDQVLPDFGYRIREDSH